MILGALLAPCNVYSGLKIGWSFNMSITALLLAFAFWVPLCRALGLAPWGVLESNINQTTASAAASIISGGLVAPIPALALISGDNLPWPSLMIWVFTVSFLGIWVAWYLRPRFILRSNLVFPAGVATAETVRDIFSRGREGARRVSALGISLTGAALVNFIDDYLWQIPRWSPSLAAKQLTFSFDPSLLLLGFGSLIGLRAGAGLLLGALIAWGGIAPLLIERGLVAAPFGDNGFQVLVGWLLWPGVTMMVVASLSDLALALIKSRSVADAGQHRVAEPGNRVRFGGLLLAAALAVLVQVLLFDIALVMALAAVPLAFVLAVVAARVTGETGIPPIGAIGKVSQLSYGLMAPGQTVTNLMTANVAGGAAGQCADLLNDFRAGHAIGARPGRQVAAQCLGILTGSIVGSLVYLSLIADPATELLTSEWPAPAVATWKAVAETLSVGLDGLPTASLPAMSAAAVFAVSLSIFERDRSGRIRAWLPSGTTLGLAFVIPASVSITLFIGALLGVALHRLVPNWSTRFLISAAAGLVAGESLYGVIAVWL